jgi:predicted nucleotide-binding protein (sugar kinase/HSP70/actin superfamily)
VLPESDERTLLYSSKVTSGKECLPYRVTLGDFMRVFYEGDGIEPKDVEGFLGSAYGPCRFGKYAIEQIRILREIGFDLPMRTSVSNNAYHDFNLGTKFELLTWRGIVAMDYLQRLVWRTRPYEKSAGAADELFDEYTVRIADRIRRKEAFDDVLKDATVKFKSLIAPEMQGLRLLSLQLESGLSISRTATSRTGLGIGT